jgi:ribosome-associated heat shock protein Hsp15
VGSGRIDRWLWAVRVTPTRTAATELCRGGHVRVNGASAKPSMAIHPGDTVTAFVADRQRIFEVVEVIDKRVGAAVAAGCFIDRSPAPPVRDDRLGVLTRDRSTGRPTKRDRREIDRFRGR